MKTKNQISRYNLILIVCMAFASFNVAASCRVDTIYESDRYAGTIENRRISQLIYTYNNDTNVTRSLLQVFNGDSGRYLGYQRDTFIYDASKRVVINSSELYNVATGIWRKNKKIENTYSASGVLIEQLTSFGFGMATWQLGNKTTYTLDGANNVIEEVFQSWVTATSSWKNLQRWTRIYSSNRLTSEIRYDYNTTTLVWDEKDKKEFRRNGLGQVTQSIFYYADPSSSVWDSTERHTYSYTGINVTFETSEEKTNNASPWVYFSKAFQKFNTGTFQLLERRELNYDATNNVWDSVQKEVYTYSATNDMVQYKKHSFFDATTDLYGWYLQKDYKCADFNVGVAELPEAIAFSVYPNPVNENKLTISTSTETSYHLFNISGKTLLIGELKAGENIIQLQDFSEGIYFIKIGNNTKRFIKN